MLQVTLLNSPYNNKPGASQVHRSQHCRKTYTLKRKKGKINARMNAITQRNPTSPVLAKLRNEVDLLAFEISELIINKLNERKAKAVTKNKDK